MPKSSFEESIKIAQSVIDTEDPDVIVGSSRGGAVAMCVEPRDAKLVLIAPAWKRFERSSEETIKSKCVVLHSAGDDIVNIEDSVELCENETQASLITVGDNHRMNDSDALEGLLDAVKWVTQ
jgi:alpha/beta superfamily hydrolase